MRAWHKPDARLTQSLEICPTRPQIAFFVMADSILVIEQARGGKPTRGMQWEADPAKYHPPRQCLRVCIDRCVDTYVDMCVGISVHTCIGMYVYTCIDMSYDK